MRDPTRHPALPERRNSDPSSATRLDRAPDSTDRPNPSFREYWPLVEAHLRFTTQDTGNVENYRVCWKEVEELSDEMFGRLGDLRIRHWTRTTATRTVRALANKSSGEPRSLSTLAGKVNALAAVFRRASLDRHPYTDEPIYPSPNPFRNKMALLREVFGNDEIEARERSEEVRPYSRNELNRLLAVSRARSWSDYLILLLAARCGLRRSEAVALCWEDFNRDARTVSIRRKASKPRNVATRVSTQLKTANSRRTIPVPSDAWQEVELWREHCTHRASIGASPYSNYTQPSRRSTPQPQSAYLFPPRRRGKSTAPVLDPDSWAQRLKRDLRRAGIDPSGRRHFAHNLRHTYASELLARGADLSQVAKLLGDTLNVAENYYAHLVQSKRLQALADSLADEV